MLKEIEEEFNSILEKKWFPLLHSEEKLSSLKDKIIEHIKNLELKLAAIEEKNVKKKGEKTEPITKVTE